MRIRPNLKPITPILASAALGWACWGSALPTWVQGSVILVPVLWASAANRLIAGLVLMAYASAASRGLVLGSMNYFDTHLGMGLLIWLVPNLCTCALGAICWQQHQKVRALLIPVLLALWILPPVGLVGWAHPLTASGWLFPTTGWYGLGLATVTMMLLSLKSPARNALLALVPVLLLSTAIYKPVKPLDGFTGVNTAFHFGVGANPERNPMQEIERHWSMQDQISDKGEGTFIFAETVGGQWNQMAAQSWQQFLKSSPKTKVLIGIHEPQEKGSYFNAIIAIDHQQAEVIYRQRLPIPLGMWRPWEEGSATPQWLNQPGSVPMGGRNIGFLICYEASLVWPVLHSVLQGADTLVSTSSTWWAPKSVRRAQHQAITSWANLFDLPLVEAHNL